jgi:hypothetical protein
MLQEAKANRLTWEELKARKPCPGCGRPMQDRQQWSGDGKGLIHLTLQERARYDAEEARYRKRHSDCHAHQWTIGGSLTKHCGKCCPPPPMSPEATARVAAILSAAAKAQALTAQTTRRDKRV